MKMLPIKFRASYSDEKFPFMEDTRDGFSTISNEKERITARYVDISFHKWAHGVYMQAEIVECVTPRTREEGGFVIWDAPFERKLNDITVYDYPLNKEAIIPNANQVRLMKALYSNDLRGEYADEIAHSLYVDLIVLEPKSNFEKYLPEVKAYYEDWVEQGWWENKSHG